MSITDNMDIEKKMRKITVGLSYWVKRNDINKGKKSGMLEGIT